MTDQELERALALALAEAPADPPAHRVIDLRVMAIQKAARPTEGDAAGADDDVPAVTAAGADDPAVATGPSPTDPAPTDPAPTVRADPADPADPADRAAPRRASRARWALAASVAAVVGAGAMLGGVVVGRQTAEDEVLARGVPEFTAVLQDDGAAVDVQAARSPEGRIVRVRSDSLPDLPVGEYYEMWFLAPDDGPGSLDRISAGTFHPAYDGSGTDVVLHAAVDPALYPGIEITREQPDGDPAPSSDVVLQGSVELLDG